MPLLGGIIAIVNVVEVEAVVEELNIELVGSGGVDLGVEARLPSGIDTIDTSASIA